MAKEKFKAELDIENKGFVNGLAEAEGRVGKFAQMIGKLTIILGIAGAAFGVMISWFKETVAGAEVMNTTLMVSKQILNDIMMGQGIQIKEAWKNAQLQNKINEDNAVEIYKVAKLQKELNLLVVAAADQTKTLTERKELMNKAMEKEHELKAFLLADAIEEKKAAWDQWQAQIANTKAREQFYKAAARVEEVQGMDSRRLMSQYSGLMEQQAQRARDLVDAFTPVPKVIEEVNKAFEDSAINNASLGPAARGNMKGLPGFENQLPGLREQNFNMPEAIKEFSSMQEALMNLSSTFSKFFSDVNLGFQGMIDGIITGLKRLVMELIAKASILAILSLITGVPLSGAMFKSLLFGGDIGSLIKGGAIPSGGAMPATNTTNNLNITGSISGKDIALSLRRNA